MILRLYKSPAEIIYGFDLNSSKFLYDGKNVYCSEGGKYSYDNKINYFDLDRVSSSYPYRLAKYKRRGYKIVLQNFDKDKINKDAIIKYFNMKPDISKILGLTDLDKIFEKEYSAIAYESEYMIKINKEYNDSFKNIYIITFLVNYFASIPNENRVKLTPQLVLYLSILYDIYPQNIIQHNILDKDYIEKTIDRPKFIYYKSSLKNEYFDYNLTYHKNLLYANYKNYDSFIKHLNDNNKYAKEIKIFYDNVKWMEHDVMKQLTGTFNPQTIEDIEEWYKIGGFYS